MMLSVPTTTLGALGSTSTFENTISAGNVLNTGPATQSEFSGSLPAYAATPRTYHS